MPVTTRGQKRTTRGLGGEFADAATPARTGDGSPQAARAREEAALRELAEATAARQAAERQEREDERAAAEEGERLRKQQRRRATAAAQSREEKTRQAAAKRKKATRLRRKEREDEKAFGDWEESPGVQRRTAAREEKLRKRNERTMKRNEEAKAVGGGGSRPAPEEIAALFQDYFGSRGGAEDQGSSQLQRQLRDSALAFRRAELEKMTADIDNARMLTRYSDLDDPRNQGAACRLWSTRIREYVGSPEAWVVAVEFVNAMRLALKHSQEDGHAFALRWGQAAQGHLTAWVDQRSNEERVTLSDLIKLAHTHPGTVGHELIALQFGTDDSLWPAALPALLAVVGRHMYYLLRDAAAEFVYAQTLDQWKGRIDHDMFIRWLKSNPSGALPSGLIRPSQGALPHPRQAAGGNTQTRCSKCKQAGHRRRNCPTRNQ